MVTADLGLRRRLFQCPCEDCCGDPGGPVAMDHHAINRVMATLDERQRRLVGGVLALGRGHGGILALAVITGLSRTTIRRGIDEVRRPIEHRLFSAISANWRGEPLKNYETILNYIRATTTTTGLRCRAMLDTTDYPIGAKGKITKEQQRAIRIRRSKVLPQWNYTIFPRKKRPTCF